MRKHFSLENTIVFLFGSTFPIPETTDTDYWDRTVTLLLAITNAVEPVALGYTYRRNSQEK
jgi:hypothetical protein